MPSILPEVQAWRQDVGRSRSLTDWEAQAEDPTKATESEERMMNTKLSGVSIDGNMRSLGFITANLENLGFFVEN